MKKALFLVGDYWHHADTLQPLAELLFDASQWEVCFTEDPAQLFAFQPDLVISFKDPVENDQIPTPVWCGDAWTQRLFRLVEQGCGLMLMHAALTDMPAKHAIVTQMIQSIFVTHPPQCPVTVRPVKAHPVMAGVAAFTFPEPDEHYVMEMLADAHVEMLAYTESRHGQQPGVWVKRLGAGRVCCITPGHTTKNLTCDAYVQLLKNAANWCTAGK